MKRSYAVYSAALLLLPAVFAAPAEAVDLSYPAAEYTYMIELTAPPDAEKDSLTDGMESTGCKFSEGDTLTLKCNAQIGGIYIKFDFKQTKWFATSGETAIQFGTNGFLHEYADVSQLDNGEITMRDTDFQSRQAARRCTALAAAV